jgi:hypothetical protein
VVERSVLEALDRIEARADRPHRKSANVVERLADDFGVNRRYGYDALCTMSQPWLLHMPLIDFHGNCGSPDEYDRPAGPRYTEVRLSRAGQIVLAAERGTGPRVPVVLINGDLHVDGSAPPYSPTRVMATLGALIDDPRLSDDEIVERVGPPVSPTGCGVTCDHRALAAGEGTAMMLTAQLSYEHVDGADLIVLTNLPLGVGDDTVRQALAARVEVLSGHDPDWDPDELALPLNDVRIESHGNGTRIVCELVDGTRPEECEAQIASTYGVSIRSEVQLPVPLPQLMRELINDDPIAQRAALAAVATAWHGRAEGLQAEGRLMRVSYATVFVLPDTANQDHRYATPEEAALAESRRLDEKPRLVSVELRDESNAEVEVDLGRHPADRVVYRCMREDDGRWFVEGSSQWFTETPVNVEAALPRDDLGLYIVQSPIGGYELMITGYDFKSTHASHHATIEEAKAYAAERTGLSDLEWQPKTSFEEGSWCRFWIGDERNAFGTRSGRPVPSQAAQREGVGRRHILSCRPELHGRVANMVREPEGRGRAR